MSQIDVFIVAAEPSADLHGEKLVRDLLQLRPGLKIAAVAGPRMREFPIETVLRMEELQVMGFVDVLRALPKIARIFFVIRKKILDMQPKAVICIDYPGFNLRLEKSLRKKGYTGKLIHYISPTVWAWGKKRIPLMAENLDLLLTLFPFEKECFANTRLPVVYVGHPLIAAIPRQKKTPSNTLALFPGSRIAEIRRNLPIQIAVAKKLKEQHPELDIAISVGHPAVRDVAKDFPCRFVPLEQTYPLMQKSRLALATSGTVTLELALHETPTIVNFAIRPLDLFLAQKIFKINLPFYCIVNIIAKEEVFPEFFGSHLTEEALHAAAKKLLYHEETRAACLEGCQKVRYLLECEEIPQNTPQLILQSLSS